MNKRKVRFLLVIFAPVAVFGCFVFLGLNAKHGKPWATADQLANSRSEWNKSFQSPETVVDVHDVRRFNRIVEITLASVSGLSDEQKSLARNTLVTLVTAVNSGDLQRFLSVRVRPGYLLPDGYAAALDKYVRLAHAKEGATALDNYQILWKQTFGQGEFWNRIALTLSNSFNFERTSHVFGNYFMPSFMKGTNAFYLESTVSNPFDYHDMARKLVRDEGQVLIWKCLFIGECKPNEKQPFMIVFFWHPKWHAWIPLQFSHGSIGQQRVPLRFF